MTVDTAYLLPNIRVDQALDMLDEAKTQRMVNRSMLDQEHARYEDSEYGPKVNRYIATAMMATMLALMDDPSECTPTPQWLIGLESDSVVIPMNEVIQLAWGEWTKPLEEPKMNGIAAMFAGQADKAIVRKVPIYYASHPFHAHINSVLLEEADAFQEAVGYVTSMTQGFTERSRTDRYLELLITIMEKDDATEGTEGA
jgi:hypothetical protein